MKQRKILSKLSKYNKNKKHSTKYSTKHSKHLKHKIKKYPRGTKNRNILKTNIKHKTKIKKSNTLCAPFIKPLDFSKTGGLNKSNINIIQSATDETCFTIDALRKIADKWNETNPNNLIEYNEKTKGKMLWTSINNVMRKKCNNEVCWIKQDFIKDSSLYKELLKNFKPLMPKTWDNKPTEWLNTLDIRDVMNQYEIKYPNFEFIGPVPIDFDSKIGFGQCVIDELCKISIKSLLDKGKTQIGVVFNLDKHNEPGSHWVAMHCCLKNKRISEICYWDSYGMKPNPEVVILMNRLKIQGSELGYNIRIKINNIRHQYKNSECGVYCIYFLTSLLEGKTFEEIIKNIISDDKMNAKRKIFFAKVDSI